MQAQFFKIAYECSYIVTVRPCERLAFACATLVEEKDVVMRGIKKPIFPCASAPGPAMQVNNRLTFVIAVAGVVQPMPRAYVKQAGFVWLLFGIERQA
jgi:hypothetical protein